MGFLKEKDSFWACFRAHWLPTFSSVQDTATRCILRQTALLTRHIAVLLIQLLFRHHCTHLDLIVRIRLFRDAQWEKEQWYSQNDISDPTNDETEPPRTDPIGTGWIDIDWT